MLCEMGVVTITLLHIISGSNPSEEAKQKRQDLGALLASLATTLMAFGLTILGAGNSLSSAKVVVQRISAAGSAITKCRITTRMSAAGKT